MDDMAGIDYSRKNEFNWISIIRLPDFVKKEDFEIDIDPKEYDLYKLIMSNVKYDESSIMLIIIIDNKGNEYSQFVHSNIFTRDI